jgi:hypothetical protein
MKRVIAGLILALLPSLAVGQGAVLQGGVPIGGHVPQYIASGGSQAIVIDGGGAGGGPIGVNPSELGITARGTGTAPYAAQGSGPLGTIGCFYDAPTNNATGYHYLCLSPNALGGGLLAYGAGGVASTLPLSFYVNGSTYAFPFVTGGIVGPATTVVNDAACWNNLVGTLLKDCGAFVTVGGNNTWTGTNNFTGAFQIGGVAQTFPASGNILGNSDVQTITNKSIGASQINSGTLSAVVFPALTGDVTNSAGSLATTISSGVVTNTKLAVAGAQNTVKGAATSTTIADLAVPSCSGASNALQWVTNTGYQCGTLGAQSAGWGLTLGGGVLSVSTTQPPYGFDAPVNLGLSAAAAGSNLTITLTGANGSNASATNPVSIPFRSGTLATGVPVWAEITGALTLVIPSGATLGTASSNVPFRIWIFASYNGGTPQLAAAVCSSTTQVFPCASWEYTRITSTTISGLATSSGTLYATAGVSNDPVRIIGYCDYSAGLATAGAWASACTTLQLFGPGVKKPGDVVQDIYSATTTPGTNANNTTTLTAFATSPSISITPSSSPNLVRVTTRGTASASAAASCQISLARGTTPIGALQAIISSTANFPMPIALDVIDAPGVATSTTYSFYGRVYTSETCSYPTGTTPSLSPASGATLEAVEIMGSLEPANDNEPLSMVG